MFHNRHDGERNQPLLPSGCTSYLRKVPMGISFTSPSMAAIRSDQIHMICHDKSDIHMIYGETKVLEIEDRRDRRHRGSLEGGTYRKSAVGSSSQDFTLTAGAVTSLKSVVCGHLWQLLPQWTQGTDV